MCSISEVSSQQYISPVLECDKHCPGANDSVFHTNTFDHQAQAIATTVYHSMQLQGSFDLEDVSKTSKVARKLSASSVVYLSILRKQQLENAVDSLNSSPAQLTPPSSNNALPTKPAPNSTPSRAQLLKSSQGSSVLFVGGNRIVQQQSSVIFAPIVSIPSQLPPMWTKRFSDNSSLLQALYDGGKNYTLPLTLRSCILGVNTLCDLSKFSSNDILVTSQPRGGQTCVLQALDRMIHPKSSSCFSQRVEFLNNNSSNKVPSNPRIFHTHSPIVLNSPTSTCAKVIYVVRNSLAVKKSWAKILQGIGMHVGYAVAEEGDDIQSNDDIGAYYMQPYLSFPNVHVVVFEELMANPHVVLEALAKFVGNTDCGSALECVASQKGETHNSTTPRHLDFVLAVKAQVANQSMDVDAAEEKELKTLEMEKDSHAKQRGRKSSLFFRRVSHTLESTPSSSSSSLSPEDLDSLGRQKKGTRSTLFNLVRFFESGSSSKV